MGWVIQREAPPRRCLSDFYGATQLGRYVGDTLAAMDWMQRTYGTTSFIAAGLCGGALTGLLTAARDPRIVGLVGLSIPVILDGSDRDASRYMTAGTAAPKLGPATFASYVSASGAPGCGC